MALAIILHRYCVPFFCDRDFNEYYHIILDKTSVMFIIREGFGSTKRKQTVHYTSFFLSKMTVGALHVGWSESVGDARGDIIAELINRARAEAEEKFTKAWGDLDFAIPFKFDKVADSIALADYNVLKEDLAI